MTMHMPTFFAWVRRAPFGGRLSQAQVDGLNDTIEAWETLGDGDDRKLAYVLATEFHETGAKMQPVRETFAATDRQARRNLAHREYAQPHPQTGRSYYGRGKVQLTWYDNYLRMGEILGLPLTDNPDLLLKSDVSAKVMIVGMMRGVFTGRGLRRYFTDEGADPVGARRIVNGTDKDSLIAGYYEFFLSAIKGAKEAQAGERAKEDGTPERVNPLKDITSIGGAISAVGTAVGGAVAAVDRIDDMFSLVAFGIIAVGVVLVATGRISLDRSEGK